MSGKRIIEGLEQAIEDTRATGIGVMVGDHRIAPEDFFILPNPWRSITHVGKREKIIGWLNEPRGPTTCWLGPGGHWVAFGQIVQPTYFMDYTEPKDGGASI